MLSSLGFRADTNAISDIVKSPFTIINPSRMRISIYYFLKLHAASFPLHTCSEIQHGQLILARPYLFFTTTSFKLQAASHSYKFNLFQPIYLVFTSTDTSLKRAA